MLFADQTIAREVFKTVMKSASKQGRERSRANPAIDLKAACEALHRILRVLGKGVFGRLELVRALGHGGSVGGVGARKVGALVQFGILARKGQGRYGPTQLGERLIRLPQESPEWAEALLRAFCFPPLYRLLVNRFQPDGWLPLELSFILAREYGITLKASPRAAEVFESSAAYAGVLTEEREFRLPMEESIPGLSEQRFRPGLQTVAFPLTEGKAAHFRIPSRLNPKDIEIMRKQIEVLELQSSP